MACIFTTSPGTGLNVSGDLLSTINARVGINGELATSRLWRILMSPGVCREDEEALNYSAQLPRVDANDSSKITKEIYSQKLIENDDDEMVPAFYVMKLDAEGNAVIDEDAEDFTDETTTTVKKMLTEKDPDDEDLVEGEDYIMVTLENLPVIVENEMLTGSTFEVSIVVPEEDEDEDDEDGDTSYFTVPGEDEEGDVDGEEGYFRLPTNIITVNDLVRRFGALPYKIKVTPDEDTVTKLSAIASSIEEESSYLGPEDGSEVGENYLKAGEEVLVGATVSVKNRDKETLIDINDFLTDGYEVEVNTDLTNHFSMVYTLLFLERPYDGAPAQYRTDVYSESIRLDYFNK